MEGASRGSPPQSPALPGQHLLFKPRLLKAILTGQGQGELWPQLLPRAWLRMPPMGTPSPWHPGLAQISSMYKQRTQDRPPRAG